MIENKNLLNILYYTLEYIENLFLFLRNRLKII